MIALRLRQRATDAVFVGIGVALLIVLWIIGGKAGWGKGMVVTPAEAVRPISGRSREVYKRALVATVWEAFRGLLIGGGVAFLLALIAASVSSLQRSISRLAALANAAPWVAVGPIFLVILGRNRGPVAVATIAVFFYVFVSTSLGLGAAPASAHDVATALGASRRRRVWSVQLPACWPSVLNGLKLAAPASLAGAIFGEWYGAERGLGVLLISAMQGARADRLWASSLLCAACGLVAYGVLAAARSLAVRRYGATITQSADAFVRRRRAFLFNVARDAVASAVLVVVLTTLWWAWIEIDHVSPLVAPRPSAVWTDLHTSPHFYFSATVATLQTAGIALVLGVVGGVATAFLASRARILQGLVVPVVVLLAATPLVALFPLFARVLGYQPNTVRALAAVLVFYPVFIYTRSGLAAASRSTLDLVDALGAPPTRRFRLVIVPEAVPHFISGLRIAASSAVIAAVVGESIIGRRGLGREFHYAYNLILLPRAFGVAIVIITVSVVVFALFGWVERVVHTRWS